MRIGERNFHSRAEEAFAKIPKESLPNGCQILHFSHVISRIFHAADNKNVIIKTSYRVFMVAFSVLTVVPAFVMATMHNQKVPVRLQEYKKQFIEDYTSKLREKKMNIFACSGAVMAVMSVVKQVNVFNSLFGTRNWVGIGKKIALVAASVLVCSLVLYESGKALDFFAKKLLENNKLISMVPYLQIAGKLFSKSGEYLFLSLSIPVYTGSYVFPKWVLQVALPSVGRKLVQWCHWTIREVLAPMTHFIVHRLEKLALQILSKIQWIQDHMLKPLGQFLIRVLEKIGSKLEVLAHKVLSGFRFVGKQISFLVRPVFALIKKGIVLVDSSLHYLSDHVIKPVCRAILSVARKIILDPIRKTLHFIFDKSMQWTVFIGKKIFHMSKWVLSHILVPTIEKVVAYMNSLGRFLLRYVMEPIDKAISFLYENIIIAPIAKIIEMTKIAARWTFTNVIYPIVKGVFTLLNVTWKSFSKISKSMHNYLILPLYHAISYLFQKTICAISFLLRNLLVNPIIKMLELTGIVANWCFTSIIQPVGKSIFYMLNLAGSGISKVYRSIQAHIMLPLYQASAIILQKIERVLKAIGEIIKATFQEIVATTQTMCSSLYEKTVYFFSGKPLMKKVSAQ